MAVIERLDEEESYLWAILSDPSGLDQAEFTWPDPQNEDNCFRAWDFQWRWWRNKEGRQIDQCSRSVGKSQSIIVRACAFPFVNPKQEMVITAPEGVHLDAVTDKIETQITSTRLLRYMLERSRGKSAIKHKPFMINFSNGSRIMGRIPQRDGKGLKGIHPVWLELDEAQDFPKPAWVEIIETLKQGNKGAIWRAHGVTRGVRDEFYRYTQPGSGWFVNRYTAMARPDWTDEERQQKIRDYGGSEEHPDYKRNVLGLHGDATNPLFVLHRLMKCVDQNQTSEYNLDVYHYQKISAEELEDTGGTISDMINFPPSHKKTYQKFWAGMDVGYTNHPSEILVFGEHTPRGKKDSTLTLLTRIKLDRIGHGDQVECIKHVVSWYKTEIFAMDKTGLGLPLFQDVQQRFPALAHRIKGYGFSERILVDFDITKDVDEFHGDMIKDSGIQKNVLEYATDCLRDWVDHERLQLPWDKELLAEFEGQTYYVVKDNMNQYGKREYSQGKFHALDAARMAALGHVQAPIEEMTKEQKWVPPETVFFQ